VSAAAATIDLTALRRRTLAGGLVFLAACAAGAVASPGQFYRSYLVAYLFWIGIALGCLGIVMLHNLVGGAWGFAIRRLLESGIRTLPLMLVLILPLLFGLRHLYVWANPEAVAADELLRHKSVYLNVPFFLIRIAIYFAAWIGLAYLLSKWSNEPSLGKLQKLSGPGILLYGVTVSFAAVDWVMSLEPQWFSTIYGVIFLIGEVLTALAFVIAALRFLSNDKAGGGADPQQFHDLGNLLLAFVMLWAYVAFSQFLIIWSGNLPEEIPWYISRLHGGWGWMAGIQIGFHFVAPFLLLLSRENKRRLGRLAAVAGALVIMRFLDLVWIVVPAFSPREFRIHWMDLAAPLGMGGIWIAVFVHQLKGRPLVEVPHENA